MGPITIEDPSPDGAEEVRLRLAPKATNARLARLTVTALASRMAYSYDEIEDLRIAVGEVCGILFDPGPGPAPDADQAAGAISKGTESVGTESKGTESVGSVEVVCTVSDESLRVQTTRSTGHPDLVVTDMNRQILESVVDELEIDPNPTAPSVTFTKRRRI